METDASTMSIRNGCSVRACVCVCAKSLQRGRGTCSFKLKTWHPPIDDLVWGHGGAWSHECSLWTVEWRVREKATLLFSITATVGEPLNTGSPLRSRAPHTEPEHFYTACYYHISSVFMLCRGRCTALDLALNSCCFTGLRVLLF